MPERDSFTVICLSEGVDGHTMLSDSYERDFTELNRHQFCIIEGQISKLDWESNRSLSSILCSGPVRGT